MTAPLDFTPSDEAIAGQCSRLLAFLRQYGEVSTITARDELNILAPAGRIFDLRRAGHSIKTRRGVAYDSRGRKHPNALYVLMGGAS